MGKQGQLSWACHAQLRCQQVPAGASRCSDQSILTPGQQAAVGVAHAGELQRTDGIINALGAPRLSLSLLQKQMTPAGKWLESVVCGQQHAECMRGRRTGATS